MLYDCKLAISDSVTLGKKLGRMFDREKLRPIVDLTTIFYGGIYCLEIDQK